MYAQTLNVIEVKENKLYIYFKLLLMFHSPILSLAGLPERL